MTEVTSTTADVPKKSGNPLRALYHFMLRLAGGKQAEPALAVVAFAESSFFPIPPDVMLAPMCFARPDRAFRFALVCTIASVFGAAAGYAIGFFVFETVGKVILDFLGYSGQEESLKALYAEYGVLTTLIAGFTPIPFKLVTIASGAMSFAFLPFIAACVVARGARFFLVAWLFKKFGPALAPVIEKRIGLFSLLFVVLLVGGVVALKFMH
jgi:membrane protein YqaA with SNARE-associated domain